MKDGLVPSVRRVMVATNKVEVTMETSTIQRRSINYMAVLPWQGLPSEVGGK